MGEHWGIPGVGGSLGECALCGKSFVSEILFGESCVSFGVEGIAQTLYAHKKCIEDLEQIRGKHWTELPEGPLRRCYQKHFAKAEMPPSSTS